MKTNTTRFSDRVVDYMKYRPKYPTNMIDLLRREIGLEENHIVADIGSGTGISSDLFIKNGNKVFGVEPNVEMRHAAEQLFEDETKFVSVDGSAEKSNLESESVDFIFCGQAFHWFDKFQAKLEFNRILKPTGHIVLAWNVRNENDLFQKGYEQLLRNNIPEYNDVTHKNISDNDIIRFFSPATLFKSSLKNHQIFDLEGLKGRLRSSSYCPKTGKEFEKLMKKIEDLFHKFEKDKLVRFDYITNLYWC
jgi:ubiquinone/menaquinone biosynthesis C-methylase UbiE